MCKQSYMCTCMCVYSSCNVQENVVTSIASACIVCVYIHVQGLRYCIGWELHDDRYIDATQSPTSRVAQWERAGPITQRSMDRNHPLLDFLANF